MREASCAPETKDDPARPARVFLLSPAKCSGERALRLLDPGNSAALAQRIQSASGAPIGEVFAFLSSLYFRGKLAYSTQFARAPQGMPAVYVITPGAGLCDVQMPLTAALLREFRKVSVARDDARYTGPLMRDAVALAQRCGPSAEVVLLGSIASGKYTDILLQAFKRRLLFPTEFVGRGDMSRGGLLLRSSEAGVELSYTAIDGAVLRGPRVAKLAPKPKN